MAFGTCPITKGACDSGCLWRINGKCAILYIADAVDAIEASVK